ncbi:MAG: cation diffusion facilitator family transporter [Candidatus Marinimicrobia bacterium]|nr:cation diffusion facilitator family transporter [Candidatus Neomarinimicrobiota bacterium]
MKNTSPEKFALNEGRLSLVGNLVLFGLKFWAGLISASSALIADAWHTLSDSLSSLIIIIAVRISGKKADDEHPFGHGRAELIAAMIVGMLLVLIAVDFFTEGIHRLSNHTQAKYGLIAIIVTIASIIVKELMAQYAFSMYRKTAFLSLKADGWHHRSDAISSVIILVGIVFGRFVWWVDGVLTLLVALMIGWTALQIIIEGVKPLLGESPDAELLNYLSTRCDELMEMETHVHHVHLHRYGRHLELTFHLKLPPKMSLQEAHDHVTLVEKMIKEEKDIDATIHVEPLSIDKEQLTKDNLTQ